MADAEISWPNVLTPLPAQTWNDGDMAVFDAATNTFRPATPSDGGGGAPVPSSLVTGLFAVPAVGGGIPANDRRDFYPYFNFGWRGLAATLTQPNLVYGAASPLPQATLEIDDWPDTAFDGLDYTAHLTVVSADGSNVGLLSSATTLPIHTPGNVLLDSNDGTWTFEAVTGSDLSYDGDGLITAAGGAYSAVLTVTIGWD